MGGLARALGRLVIMAAVMAAVVITCLIAGVGTTIALALGVVLAGLVGLIGVVRESRGSAALASSPHAAATAHRSVAAVVVGHGGSGAPAPTDPAQVDPESLMPRWRRPSLLEARRADPGRPTTQSHGPLTFDGRAGPGTDRRVIRYAVVTVVDRPDEVQGMRVTDLGAGDEVEVVGVVGAFLEVVAPSGAHGWIHRTTVSHRTPAYATPAAMVEIPVEAEDVLTALLAARGLH